VCLCLIPQPHTMLYMKYTCIVSVTFPKMKAGGSSPWTGHGASDWLPQPCRPRFCTHPQASLPLAKASAAGLAARTGSTGHRVVSAELPGPTSRGQRHPRAQIPSQPLPQHAYAQEGGYGAAVPWGAVGGPPGDQHPAQHHGGPVLRHWSGPLPRSGVPPGRIFWFSIHLHVLVWCASLNTPGRLGC
jgi:hypothetical protein